MYFGESDRENAEREKEDTEYLKKKSSNNSMTVDNPSSKQFLLTRRKLIMINLPNEATAELTAGNLREKFQN